MKRSRPMSHDEATYFDGVSLLSAWHRGTRPPGAAAAVSGHLMRFGPTIVCTPGPAKPGIVYSLVDGRIVSSPGPAAEAAPAPSVAAG